MPEDSLAVQWLNLGTPIAGGTDLISGWRTKVLHTTQSSQKQNMRDAFISEYLFLHLDRKGLSNVPSQSQVAKDKLYWTLPEKKKKKKKLLFKWYLYSNLYSKEIEKQLQKWVKYFTNTVSAKELISKLHKNSYNSIIKDKYCKKSAKELSKHFYRTMWHWWLETWKDVQLNFSSLCESAYSVMSDSLWFPGSNLWEMQIKTIPLFLGSWVLLLFSH